MEIEKIEIQKVQEKLESVQKVKQEIVEEAKPFTVFNEMLILERCQELSAHEQIELLKSMVVANNLKKKASNIVQNIKTALKIKNMTKDERDAYYKKTSDLVKSANKKRTEKTKSNEELLMENKIISSLRKDLHKRLIEQKVKPSVANEIEIKSLREKLQKYQANRALNKIKGSKIYQGCTKENFNVKLFLSYEKKQ